MFNVKCVHPSPKDFGSLRDVGVPFNIQHSTFNIQHSNLYLYGRSCGENHFGSVTTNAAPLPGSLSTSMLPRCWRMRCLVMARPRPEPAISWERLLSMR